jgi:hypothetical protein
MNNWCICWFLRVFLLGILIFKGLTERRLYKSFGVKEVNKGTGMSSRERWNARETFTWLGTSSRKQDSVSTTMSPRVTYYAENFSMKVVFSSPWKTTSRKGRFLLSCDFLLRLYGLVLTVSCLLPSSKSLLVSPTLNYCVTLFAVVLRLQFLNRRKEIARKCCLTGRNPLLLGKGRVLSGNHWPHPRYFVHNSISDTPWSFN